MGFAEIENFLWAGISFLTFFMICAGLLEGRFHQKKTWVIGGGLLAGIILLQAGLLLAGQDQALVLTLLPLTAYLPVVIGLHILSASGFFQTVAVWTFGLLASSTLSLFQKLQLRYFRAAEMVHWQRGLVETVCLLAVAALLLFIVFRYIRKPFQTYVLQGKVNWLPLCFPVVMVFLLFSYFLHSTTNMTVLVLVFLTALSVFVILARILWYAAAQRHMQETAKAVAAQLEIQRQEYETICKKMEAGRAYRHDMRHHLSVLKGLANEGGQQEILGYLDSIDGQLQAVEQKAYCENSIINAVLSSYLRRGEKAGCRVDADVKIPSEIPFDALDVCSVLANALENAVNACQKNERLENRRLSFSAVLEDHQKLIIAVENPCETPVAIGKSGFPILPEQDGHGIGLKSIESIAEKYHGLFRCQCQEGVFRLSVILFGSQPPIPPKRNGGGKKKAAAAALTACFAFFLGVNCLPAAARSLEGIPVIGALVRVVNLKTYDFSWGGTACYAVLPQVELDNILKYATPPETPTKTASSPAPEAIEGLEGEASEPSYPSDGADGSQPTEISVSDTAPEASRAISWEGGSEPAVPAVTVTAEEPQPGEAPGDSETTPPGPKPVQPDILEGVDEMNRQLESYIEELREKFLWYAARKYDGYVALESGYTVLRNDDRLLVIRFETTINAGGSGQYSRSFVLDKQAGKVLELADLFLEDSDYLRVVSDEIKGQMAARENSYDYFIPGGIWSGDDLFKEISPSQNFYINDESQLVVVFDEYEVASGKAGMPEFVIPAEILSGLLPPDSFLK